MNAPQQSGNEKLVSTGMPTLLVMAGGTGGHIFPGLAVADELATRGWNIHWLGTEQKMEADIIPKHGYDISFINIAGVRHKRWQALVTFPFKMLQSLWQSIAVIRAVKPDVVLGMGGYASAPGGVAAWLLRKPLVLHEQNAVAGMTNRYLSKLATKVLCAFPDAFSNGVESQTVGNPLRKLFSVVLEKTELDSTGVESSNTSAKDKSPSKNVLVVGGSLGAQILNETVPNAIKETKNSNIKVWHQTGKGKIAPVISAYEQLSLNGDNVEVFEFIDDVAKAYQWADVVICRAGALTVSELAMAGKPAIFVPLPHAVDDHQTKNAMFLVEQGAAKIIAQKTLNGTTLAQTLNALFSDDALLKNMAKNSLNAAKTDATKQVASVCEQLAHQSKVTVPVSNESNK